jgi:hypothetical protein
MILLYVIVDDGAVILVDSVHYYQPEGLEQSKKDDL